MRDNGGSPMTAKGVLISVTLYEDRTIYIDGRARAEKIPVILRIIADAIESGATLLTGYSQESADAPASHTE